MDSGDVRGCWQHIAVCVQYVSVNSTAIARCRVCVCVWDSLRRARLGPTSVCLAVLFVKWWNSENSEALCWQTALCLSASSVCVLDWRAHVWHRRRTIKLYYYLLIHCCQIGEVHFTTLASCTVRYLLHYIILKISCIIVFLYYLKIIKSIANCILLLVHNLVSQICFYSLKLYL